MLQSTSFASDLRMLAANNIASNPITYNEAFLGKSNWEYCEWLTKKDHWGGESAKKKSLKCFYSFNMYSALFNISYLPNTSHSY